MINKGMCRQGRQKIINSLAALCVVSFLNGCADPSQTVLGADVTEAIGKIPQKNQSKPPIALAIPQKRTKQQWLGSPLTTFTENHFIGSSRCSLCHGNLVDKDGKDMSINDHWRSTMMANAAKDPLWQAKVVSETKRNPAIKKIIEEKCITCHMPMAWFQANIDENHYGETLSDSPFETFSDTQNKLHQAAYDGVSCSLCHQVQDKGLGTVKSFSGKLHFDTETSKPDRPIYGPYQETVPEPMQTSIGFKPVYSSHTNDSALCAACHTLYTPYLDAQGNIAGEFPEQTPYLEWLHSEFGEPLGVRHDINESVGTVRTCQECHMPHSTSGGVMIARPAPRESTPKDHFSQHHFVGGNILLLNIMQDNIKQLDISASTQKIEETKKRTADLLQQQTASLAFTETKITNNILTTTVEVSSMVGHKFPTGFPSRRTWLHLTVHNSSGELVFESGRTDADGKIVGDDGDEKMSYEPHYDFIDNEDQVQIYEAVMRNTDGQTTYTLLRGAGYIKDNRILPRGFNKTSAPSDIAVYGLANADNNFLGGSDLVTYAIPVKQQTGPFTVSASLHYTTVSHSFMQDLRTDADLALVGSFVGSYDAADKTPVTIAAVEKKVR